MNEISEPTGARSDLPPAPTPAPSAGPDPLEGVAPLSAERLPPAFRKHVDPASPPAMRVMAAKGLVPLTPSDLCHCLAMLAADSDQALAGLARKTAAGLPEKITSSALRDESQNPRVLHFFADQMVGNEAVLEGILLNNAAHDATIAGIAASTTSPRLLEIVANNQLRVLRDERVLRAVLGNPCTSKALVDLTCDFAVRSGMLLSDIPAMIEAHVRVHGAPPAPPQSPQAEESRQNTAAAVLEEFGAELADPTAPPMEEGKRVNLTQRVSKMTISEKIKLATLGNREARGILMRDPNKLVALSVIQSPRISDGEVLMLANSKTCQEDVLRNIYMSRDWTRQYSIKLALVKNPKVPLAIAMRFLNTLRDAEIRDLAGNKNVPSAVRLQAKKLTERRR